MMVYTKQSVTSYSVGGCTQYGTYVGNGAQFGSNSDYSVYHQAIAGGYRLNFVKDYECVLVSHQDHINPSTAKKNIVSQKPVISLWYTNERNGMMSNPYVLAGLAALGVTGIVVAAIMMEHHKKA